MPFAWQLLLAFRGVLLFSIFSSGRERERGVKPQGKLFISKRGWTWHTWTLCVFGHRFCEASVHGHGPWRIQIGKAEPSFHKRGGAVATAHGLGPVTSLGDAWLSSLWSPRSSKCSCRVIST